jgi:hypothetical protein
MLGWRRLALCALITIGLFGLTACEDSEVPDPGAGDYLPMTLAHHDPLKCRYSRWGVARNMDVDVYRPDPTEFSGTRPVLVYLHGGGFALGDEADIDADDDFLTVRAGGSILAQLTEGWIVVSADYRLSTEQAFPAQLVDAKAAVNCAADLQEGDEKVVISGSSAGGHLATLTAFTVGDVEPASPSSFPGGELDGGAPGGGTIVDGVVNLDGPTNLENLTTGFDDDPDDLDTVFSSASPGAQITMFGTDGISYEELVPGLLCGPVSLVLTNTSCQSTVASTLDDASPWHQVGSSSDPEDVPRIYLACGNTEAMPLALEDCNDHLAFYIHLDANYGPATDDINDRVQLDYTANNSVANPDPRAGTSGNHMNIDVQLNFTELKGFLQDVVEEE